jgi:hypothetical protein
MHGVKQAPHGGLMVACDVRHEIGDAEPIAAPGQEVTCVDCLKAGGIAWPRPASPHEEAPR